MNYERRWTNESNADRADRHVLAGVFILAVVLIVAHVVRYFVGA